AVYTAKYVDELGKLIADLPPEQHAPGRFPSPLLIHAAVVAVLAIMIIAHWIVSGTMFFWPAIPLFWLGLSLAAPAVFRANRHPVPYCPRAVRPASIFLRDPDSGFRDRVVPPTAITASPGVHGPGAFVGPGTRWDSA